MWNTIRNAFKNPEIRKKLLFVLFILIIYRLGSDILIPFVNSNALNSLIKDNSIFSLLNTFSGGAFGNATLFALSITPYITAQIIVQLLTVAIPAWEKLAKEGETGRKKLDQITKWFTLGMSLLQGFGYYTLIRYQATNGMQAQFTTGWQQYFVAAVIISIFVAGAFAVTWLGDQITDKGLGNGISIILLAGILAEFPRNIQILLTKWSEGGIYYILIPFILVVFIAMVYFVVILNDGERRIPVQYAKRVVGRKMYGGQSSYIPLKVNFSSVLPIIFASSLLALPATIAQFARPKAGGFWAGFITVMSPSHWVYGILYFFLIIAFNYFYAAIQYNPIEIANNIKNNNGAIPGIRPGKPTATFITKVLSKVVFIGALFLGIIAVFPTIFNSITGIAAAMSGTSIIIIVGVALETIQILESQMMMRHHKGFLE